MQHDTIEVCTQSPKPERKVANLNTSSSGLLGVLDDLGENIPVKGTTTHDQDAGGRECRQRQKCYQAKSKNSVTIHGSSPNRGMRATSFPRKREPRALLKGHVWRAGTSTGFPLSRE